MSTPNLSSKDHQFDNWDAAQEFYLENGLTDGLPVVPPTEARVLRMLDGTSRAATDVVARVPPNLHPATVEKIAINADYVRKNLGDLVKDTDLSKFIL